MSLVKTVLTLGSRTMGSKAYIEDALMTVQNHEFVEDQANRPGIFDDVMEDEQEYR